MEKIDLLRRVNVIHHICSAALGEKHHPAIKYTCAVLIMTIGVLIAKVGGLVHAFHFHYLADLIGYAVHGIGAVPFIEWLLKLEREGAVDIQWPIILYEDNEGGID